MVPDTLVMRDILRSVSRSRSLPAITTLITSDIIFSNRQLEKMIMRCFSVCVTAKAVALSNQKKNILGLSVLTKNPERLSFTKSLFVNLNSPASTSVLSLTFLKKTKYTPIATRKRLPV